MPLNVQLAADRFDQHSQLMDSATAAQKATVTGQGNPPAETEGLFSRIGAAKEEEAATTQAATNSPIVKGVADLLQGGEGGPTAGMKGGGQGGGIHPPGKLNQLSPDEFSKGMGLTPAADVEGPEKGAEGIIGAVKQALGGEETPKPVSVTGPEEAMAKAEKGSTTTTTINGQTTTTETGAGGGAPVGTSGPVAQKPPTIAELGAEAGKSNPELAEAQKKGADFIEKWRSETANALHAARTAGRGVRSNAVTEEAAKGVDPARFSAMIRPDGGEALNAEEQVALTNQAAKLGQHIVDSVKEVTDRLWAAGKAPEDVSVADIAHIKNASDEFGSLVRLQNGASTETGRALQINQMTESLRSTNNDIASQTEDLWNNPQLRGALLRNIQAADNPAEVAAALADLHQTPPGEAAAAARDGGGVYTRIMNTFANFKLANPHLAFIKLATDSFSLLERPMLAGLQNTINKATMGWLPGADADAMAGWHTLFGESALHTFKDMVMAMRDAWNTGTMKFAKHGDGGVASWTAEYAKNGIATETPLSGGVFAHLLNIPHDLGSRWIGAVTDGMALTSERMEMNMYARFLATKRVEAQMLKRATGNASVDEALKQASIEKEVQAILSKPSQKFAKVTRDRALANLYINKPNMLGQMVGNMRRATPLGRLAALFWNVPYNIASGQIARSPVGIGAGLAGRTGLLGEGMEKASGGLVAKGALGTSMVGVCLALHHLGVMTGAGPDPDHPNGNLQQSWLEHNVPYRLGNKKFGIDYRWIPGYGVACSMGASFGDMHARMQPDDARTLGQHIGNLFTRDLPDLGSAEAHAVRDHPMIKLMTGLVTMFNSVMMGREDKMHQAINEYLADMAVPSAVSNLNRALDPTERQIHSLIEEFKSQIPGLSQTLKPVLNHVGKVQYLPGGYAPDEAPGQWRSVWNFATPATFTGYTHDAEEDKVSNVLENLSAKGYGGLFHKPPAVISGRAPSVDGGPADLLHQGVPLNEDQQFDHELFAGAYKHGQLTKLIEKDGGKYWDKLPE